MKAGYGMMRTVLIFCVWAVIVPGYLPASWAVQSEHYQQHSFVVNSAGNTCSSSGKLVMNSVGETQVGQSFGSSFSIQSGYFNDYFLPAATPTVTCTPIRTFGDAIMSEHYVFAAPNPIRGVIAHLYYDVSEPAEVTLKIFTTSNNLVISQHWDNVPAGTNRWDWNAANMANGVYLLWIRARGADGKAATIIKKIALVK